MGFSETIYHSQSFRSQLLLNLTRFYHHREAEESVNCTQSCDCSYFLSRTLARSNLEATGVDFESSVSWFACCVINIERGFLLRQWVRPTPRKLPGIRNDSAMFSICTPGNYALNESALFVSALPDMAAYDICNQLSGWRLRACYLVRVEMGSASLFFLETFKIVSGCKLRPHA